jgi:ABC-2 type transport system permease protein
MDLRAVLGARERVVGLIVVAPLLIAGSAAATLLVFFGLRAVERSSPELVVPLVSAAVTAIGIFWALSPLLAGVAFTETHDLTRLLHFPIPLPTLIASSLLANVTQPMVLAKLPVVAALAFGVTGRGLRLPAALFAALLAFAFMLAAGQAVGLLLHGLSRNRRLHDLALFAGIGAGFALSFLPLALFVGGGRGFRVLAAWVVQTGALAFSPFAWGARAAVYAGRGEWGAFALHTAWASVALVAALAGSAALAARLYRGELDLGTAGPAGAREPTRMLLPGRLGALLEKDLRVTWRDPRLKALLFTGMIGPLLVLVFFWQGGGGRVPAGVLLGLASVTGLSVFGSNAFAFEQRGLLLLMSFPVERWKILVAKNVGSLILRVPGLLMLLAMTAFLAPASMLAPVAAVAAITLLVAKGADNFQSILFPVPVPAAGQNPYGPASGGRGLGAAVVGMLLLFAALLASAPFVFLAWLPYLLGQERLWILTLPLGLAGAGAAYAMMVGGAERLLLKREPDLLARVLGEE